MQPHPFPLCGGISACEQCPDFFMCCWKPNIWFCSRKTSGNRCQMNPDEKQSRDVTHSGAVALLPSHPAESTSTHSLPPSFPQALLGAPGRRTAGNVPVQSDVRSPNTLHKKKLVLMGLFAVKSTLSLRGLMPSLCKVLAQPLFSSSEIRSWSCAAPLINK